MKHIVRLLPGLGVAAAATAIAWPISLLAPVLSPLLIAIVLGIVVGNVFPELPPTFRPGLDFAAKPLLRLGIVALGAQVVLGDILELGWLVLVLAAVVVGARGGGLRTVLRPWLVSTAGVALVAAAHVALGSNWFVGLARLRVRYYQQTASDRPYSYFVWANLAAWLVAWSPLLAYGVVRGLGVLLRSRRLGWTQDVVVALISAAGTAAALVADLSAMSKAETERIWLAFGAITYAGLALINGRRAAWALVGCGATALLINHLFYTGW